jgi:hypothetical protein
MIINKSDNYIDELEGKINLKKENTYLIKLPRNYDLLSDFSFEYYKGDVINFGEIKELPDEINMMIKTYLLPKNDVKIFLKGFDNILKSAESINNNKLLEIKQINLNMKNLGQSFYNFICNHLPIISIPYMNIYLEIKSKEDCDLLLKLKGHLLNDKLRQLVACENRYLYNDNTVICAGMIAK